MQGQKRIAMQVLDEHLRLSLTEVCGICDTRHDTIVEMVREGVVEPLDLRAPEWTFTGRGVTRIRRALRLRRDLDVNLAGAALALDLLDEIEALKRRLNRSLSR